MYESCLHVYIYIYSLIGCKPQKRSDFSRTLRMCRFRGLAITKSFSIFASSTRRQLDYLKSATKNQFKPPLRWINHHFPMVFLWFPRGLTLCHQESELLKTRRLFPKVCRQGRNVGPTGGESRTDVLMGYLKCSIKNAYMIYMV